MKLMAGLPNLQDAARYHGPDFRYTRSTKLGIVFPGLALRKLCTKILQFEEQSSRFRYQRNITLIARFFVRLSVDNFPFLRH